MAILSIQSHVAKGYVGNSAAVFILQSMGHEVWPVHTVQFSNHPGHAHVGGAVTPDAQLTDIFTGLENNGWLNECDTILSGYMGSAENGQATLDVVRRIKAKHPNSMYVCDPVMGDTPEGVYVSDSLVAFYRRDVMASADVMTPNLFELGVLVGALVSTPQSVCEAARTLIAGGPGVIIVTSINSPSHPDMLGSMLVTATHSWVVWTPFFAMNAKGVGDVFTALWTGHRRGGRPPEEALTYAASGVAALVEASVRAGSSELPIVEQMREMTAPHGFYELVAGF